MYSDIRFCLSIMFFGMNWKHPARAGVVQRWEAWVWILVFAAYTLLIFCRASGLRASH